MTSGVRPTREPKYYTVKRHLLKIIDSLEPGASVPTERDLAAELETSRTTVRQALLELVAEDLGIRAPHGRGLDVGCGAGLSTAALARLVRVSVGFDPNEDMLVHRRAVAPSASFVVAKAEAPPFADNSFELMTAAGALNYVDLSRFLPEAARLLVPGGSLVVYDFSSGRRLPGDPR